MPQTEWFKQQRVILSQSGGQKSKIKVSAGLVPSEGCEGESVPGSPLASGSLLAVFGIPWLVEVSP